MATLLDEWQAQLAEHFPACHMQRKDIATAMIAAPAGADQPGELKIDVFVHAQNAHGLEAWRLEAGRAIAEDERAHGWISISDERGDKRHFEVTCSSQRFVQIMREWLSPLSEPPSELTIADAATESSPQRKARQASAPHGPRVERELTAESLSLLQALPNAEQALLQFNAHLSRLDLASVDAHWPRDHQGRHLPRTTAVLGAYGPVTRKRQPCFLLISGSAREMPVWRVRLSNEFLHNHRHQWTDAPWMWSADTQVPGLDNKAARAQKLIAQGLLEQACDLCGIHISRNVRLLAVDLPFQKFARLHAAWPEELRTALRQLAPWRIAAGLASIQRYLESVNKRPPKPGSWERKLFWFSGQSTQVRYGLGVRIASDGQPELDIIATASNEHFPEVDWRQ